MSQYFGLSASFLGNANSSESLQQGGWQGVVGREMEAPGKGKHSKPQGARNYCGKVTKKVQVKLET